jgi:hypothetical protein
MGEGVTESLSESVARAHSVISLHLIEDRWESECAKEFRFHVICQIRSISLAVPHRAGLKRMIVRHRRGDSGGSCRKNEGPGREGLPRELVEVVFHSASAPLLDGLGVSLSGFYAG